MFYFRTNYEQNFSKIREPFLIGREVAHYHSLRSRLSGGFTLKKTLLNVVAVAEFGDNILSRSLTSAAGYYSFCRGRRIRRQIHVVVADFGRRLLLKVVAVAEFGDKILSRSPTRPPVTFHSIAVADMVELRSPTSDAFCFHSCRGRRIRRHD